MSPFMIDIIGVIGLLAYPVMIMHDVLRHPVQRVTGVPAEAGAMTTAGVPYVVGAAEPREVG